MQIEFDLSCNKSKLTKTKNSDRFGSILNQFKSI